MFLSAKPLVGLGLSADQRERERKGREFKRCLTAMLYIMFTFMFAAAAATTKKEALLLLCWAGLLAFLFSCGDLKLCV